MEWNEMEKCQICKCYDSSSCDKVQSQRKLNDTLTTMTNETMDKKGKLFTYLLLEG